MKSGQISGHFSNEKLSIFWLELFYYYWSFYELNKIGRHKSFNYNYGNAMIAGINEADMAAVSLFGIIANFLFSFLFGWYLSMNIGVQEMMLSKGDKKQPSWMVLTLLIPYLKMGITLYRVTILQFYFLNQGRTHKDFWIYLTQERRK